MTETESYPVIRYNGDWRDPDRRGFIPGVTRPPGATPGADIEVTDEMVAALNRPTGLQACWDFAEQMVTRYNANLGYQKWSLVIRKPEPVPDHVQSEEPTAPFGKVEETATDTSARTNSDEGE